MSQLVLASSSRYRRQLLSDAGIEAHIVEPDFDERSLDAQLADWGVDRYVVEVAAGKVRSVLDRVAPGTLVVGADQAAVLNGRLLTKPGTIDRAIEQLVAMSGQRHDLVNGVVVTRAGSDDLLSGVDRHLVTMRAFDRLAAEEYVERCRPLDCVGAYRVEDDGDLIDSIEGSGDDGVIGLPIELVRSLIARFD